AVTDQLEPGPSVLHEAPVAAEVPSPPARSLQGFCGRVRGQDRAVNHPLKGDNVPGPKLSPGAVAGRVRAFFVVREQRVEGRRVPRSGAGERCVWRRGGGGGGGPSGMRGAGGLGRGLPGWGRGPPAGPPPGKEGPPPPEPSSE